jgi:hypothetical protein
MSKRVIWSGRPRDGRRQHLLTPHSATSSFGRPVKTDELVGAVMALEPNDLRELLDKLAASFAAKAEATYDKNPEENGPLAQPYADIADFLSQAAFSFESDQPAIDTDEESAQPAPTTVAAAVAMRTPATVKNPWGGR